MIETVYWHTLHPRYLNSESRVSDLGANYGHFARAIVDRFDCHCTAIEPAPDAFAAIGGHSNIAKLQLAVSDFNGEATFNLSSSSTASSLFAAESVVGTTNVRVVTLAALLNELAWDNVDLLKVDIEGAEIGMLASCPEHVLRRIGQISIEFHDFIDITPRNEVLRTLDRLHGIGFQSVRMSRVGHQDTWLINQPLLGISTAEIQFIRSVVRNWHGLKRVWRRKFPHSTPQMASAN